MDTPPTPETSAETSSGAAKPAGFDAKSVFSRENLTLGLAVFAAILALAPYVLPQAQVFLVHQGLVKHPEQLKLALTALDKQQEEAQRKAFEKTILANQNTLITPDDAVIGNPKGAVTLILFHDFLCSACRASSPAVDELIAKNKDLRVVIKELPIIGGENSHLIAGMALASAKEGKYPEFYRALYQGQMKTQDDLDAAATRAGLNARTLAAEAQSSAIQNHISKNFVLGQRIGINALPMYIVNGQAVQGADLPKLEQQVALARGKTS